MRGEGGANALADTSPCRSALAALPRSIEIAAAQKKPAGRARQLAARLAHLGAAIGTIAGDVSRCRFWLLLGVGHGIRLRFVGHALTRKFNPVSPALHLENKRPPRGFKRWNAGFSGSRD